MVIAKWACVGRRFANLAAALLLVAGHHVALGQTTRDWGSAVGGGYAIPGNWAGGVVPGSLDTARFNLNATYNVTLSNATKNTTGLLVNDGAVTFATSGFTGTPVYAIADDATISGGNLTLSSGTPKIDFRVADLLSVQSGSTLSVVDGSDVDTDLLSIGGGGTIDIVGSGSTFDVLGASPVLVGATGVGTMNISGGADVTAAASMLVGDALGSTGNVSVSGAGSTWTSSSDFNVGHNGNGTLLINSGGQASNNFGRIGAVGTGTATVTGAGSTWSNSSELSIGHFGSGTLLVEAGGQLDNTIGRVGYFAGSTGSATVTGAGSTWTNSSSLNVGEVGNGTLLVEVGGQVSSATGVIGRNNGSTGSATVNGAGSTWSNGSFLTVGENGNGTLLIASGGQLSSSFGRIAEFGSASGLATVTGAGSNWTNNGSLTVGRSGNGTLLVEAGGQVNNTIGYIGEDSASTGSATVSGTGSTWANSSFLRVGSSGNGALLVESGGQVSNVLGVIGLGSVSTGLATVTGAGSTWSSSAELIVGQSGNGTLSVESGGQVNNTNGRVGLNSGSTGSATVTGAGSIWTNSGKLVVGNTGSGTLFVESGGQVTNTDGVIGESLNSTGSVTVSGAGSIWTNSESLFLGGIETAAGGQGALTIGPGGTVDIGASLKIWDQGVVNLQGGTIRFDGNGYNREPTGQFNFLAGTIQLIGDVGIDATIASLLGPNRTISFGQNLTVEGAATLLTPLVLDGGTLSVAQLASGSLLDLQRGTFHLANQAVIVEAGGVFGDRLKLKPDLVLNINNGVTNQGLIWGNGTLVGTVANAAAGEIRAEAGSNLFFDGASHANSGAVRLAGGWAEFSGTLLNAADGNITGRGTLSTAGLTNQGDLALSNGQTDIFGDVSNETTGRVIVSGNADVTFWDDVTDSGTLFNVSAGSSATFFGTAGFGVSGGGDVFFEADVTPGNSPGLEVFGGNVSFGALASLEIELGGLMAGSQFDQLAIAGNLSLAGNLVVSLIDDYALAAGQEYLIADVTGLLAGAFQGLGEGALVGAFTGRDLFITYAAGDGNDVALFTAGSAFSADFDGDDDVDGDDLVRWTAGFGTGDARADGDADLDGDVDGADFLTWQRQVGSPPLAVAANVPVPEPATCLLAILAIGGIRRRGRPRTS